MKAAHVTVEFIDGTTLTGRSITRDYVLYETTAKRQKPPWGGVAENPARFESFVAWAALKREGKVNVNYDQFLDSVAQTEFEFEETDVRPTIGANGDD